MPTKTEQMSTELSAIKALLVGVIERNPGSKCRDGLVSIEDQLAKVLQCVDAESRAIQERRAAKKAQKSTGRENGRTKPQPAAKAEAPKPFVRDHDHGTLVVGSYLQKIIFECEMSGQISDGQWENARPHNHWIAWCDANVVVAEEGEVAGRMFRAQKDNYNFGAKSLLDIVGDRILFRVKAHLVLGLTVDQLGHNFVDGVHEYDWVVEKSGDKYWGEKLEGLNAMGVTREKLQEVEDFDGFTMSDLRKEIRGLRTACKTDLITVKRELS